MNFGILTGSKKSTAKEIAEVLVDLEIKEPEIQAAVDAAEEEVVRLNQAKLFGEGASDDDVSKANKNLEAATLDLKTVQRSKEELRKRLNKSVIAELSGVQDKINALRPAFLREEERIKKNLAEKLIEAQVLLNYLREDVQGSELLDAVNHFYRETNDFMDMISEVKERSKKMVSGSVIRQMADLKSQLMIQVNDQPEAIVEKLLGIARNKAGVKVEQNAGAGIGSPSLN